MAGYDSSMTSNVSYRPSGRQLSGVNTTANTFGAGVAAAMDRSTGRIQHAIELEVRQQEQDDRRAAATAYNRAVAEMGAVEDQYSLTQGAEASEKKQEALDAKAKVREKYAKDLTPDQVALFDEDFSTFAIRYDGRIGSHAVKQQEYLDIANAEGRVLLTAQEAARSYGDPYKLAELHAEQTRSLASIAAQKGLPAGSDAEKGYVAEQMTRYHGAVLNSIIATGNLAAAQQYIEAYGSEVSPADRAELIAKVKSQQDAEAPFVLADQFFDPKKSEFEQRNALREYARANGVKPSVIRSAMADLNGRYSELDGMRRTAEAEAYSFFLGQQDFKAAVQANPDVWNAIGVEKQLKLQEHFTTKPYPVDQQAKVIKQQDVMSVTAPLSFSEQFYDQSTGEFSPPDWVNGLDKSEAKRLMELAVAIKTQGADATVYANGEPPVAQIKNMVQNDFKKRPEDKDYIEAKLLKFGEDYKAQNGVYPTIKETQQFYDLEKQNVINSRGESQIMAKVTGEYRLTTAGAADFRAKHGDAIRQLGAENLMGAGLTRKEALAAVNLMINDDEVMTTLAPMFVLQPILFRQMMRDVVAIRSGTMDSATEARRKEHQLEYAKLQGLVDAAVDSETGGYKARQSRQDALDQSMRENSRYREPR